MDESPTTILDGLRGMVQERLGEYRDRMPPDPIQALRGWALWFDALDKAIMAGELPQQWADALADVVYT